MILTVPSWVIPGTYLENLEFLADKTAIQGVELLFFLYNEEIKADLDADWEGILQKSGRYTYSAHLPDRILRDNAELVIRLLPLVRQFVVHPYAAEEALEFHKTLIHWLERYPDERYGGIERFMLENTGPGRFEAALPVLPEAMGICMDTGHLLLEGKSPAEFYHQYKDRIREIHLHGLDLEAAAKDGGLKDHRPLRAGDRWLEELAGDLKDFTGMVNLEHFSWEAMETSIAALKTLGLL